MATTKTTRSPRRAQDHPTPARARGAGRLRDLSGRLPVYEALYDLNRDFDHVLVDLARLQKLGMFHRRDLANIFRVIVLEIRAWVNLVLVEALQPRERKDFAHFVRLQNATLNKAKRFLAKKRRKAAGKKGQRKRRRAKSEGV
jgi:hypothetical protein